MKCDTTPVNHVVCKDTMLVLSIAFLMVFATETANEDPTIIQLKPRLSSFFFLRTIGS